MRRGDLLVPVSKYIIIQEALIKSKFYVIARTPTRK